MILAKLLFSFLFVLSIISLIKLEFSEGFRIKEKLFLISSFLVITTLIFEPSLLNPITQLLKLRARAIILYSYIIFSSWLIFRNHLRINSLSNKINSLVSEISILKNKLKVKK